MCSLLWPIGDDAGPGEVESGKSREPAGVSAALLWQGGKGEDRRFSDLLESHTVGAMELARTLELACSLSDEILDKLHKEFGPGFLWLKPY